MSDAEYGIANIGVAGMMHAGAMPAKVLVQVGKYWLPAVAGIGRAGIMAANSLYQGVDISYIDNLRITQSGAGQVPECTFDVVETSSAAPQEGDAVIIAIGTYYTRIFGGVLIDRSVTYLTLTRQTYHCRAVGWARDLEKHLVSGTWQQARAGAIVRELLTEHTPYFRCSAFVQDGVLLDEFQASDESLLEVCTRLASLCAFGCYIDPLRNVHFHPPAVLDAQWDVASGEHFGQLRISEESGQIKNRIFVHYSQLQAIPQTFTGDGETIDFQLEYLPQSVQQLAINDEIIVPEDYGTHYAGDKSQKLFSIDYKRGIIHTRDHDTLTSSDTLMINYTAKVPAKLIRHDRASQKARRDKEGGDGMYDFAIRSRQKILSIEDARAAADAELSQYAWPLVKGTYVRVENLFDLISTRLQPGMRQSLEYWGYDAQLEVGRVEITVLRPAADETLKWLQSAELGQVSPRLDTVLTQDMQTSSQQQEDLDLIVNEEDM